MSRSVVQGLMSASCRCRVVSLDTLVHDVSRYLMRCLKIPANRMGILTNRWE